MIGVLPRLLHELHRHVVRILFAVHASLVVNDGAGNQRSVDLGAAVGVAVVVVGKAAQVTVGCA